MLDRTRMPGNKNEPTADSGERNWAEKSVAGPLDQEAELQAVAKKKKRVGEEEEHDPCSAPNNNGPLEQDQPTTTET